MVYNETTTLNKGFIMIKKIKFEAANIASFALFVVKPNSFFE
jgi:hypothetical protein